LARYLLVDNFHDLKIIVRFMKMDDLATWRQCDTKLAKQFGNTAEL